MHTEALAIDENEAPERPRERGHFLSPEYFIRFVPAVARQENSDEKGKRLRMRA